MTSVTQANFSLSVGEGQTAADLQRLQAAVARRLRVPGERLAPATRIADARERADDWAVLYNYVQPLDDQTLLFRLDMNVRSGFALCYYSEFGAGGVFRYRLRTLWLDRATGRNVSALYPRPKDTQTFASVVALLQAVADLRREAS